MPRCDDRERGGNQSRHGQDSDERPKPPHRATLEEALPLSPDLFGRAFGLTGQNPELARLATQNVQAVTETGSVLMRGFQDISREWVELALQRFQKNTQGLTKLAQCRNLQDLAAVQSELVRENLQDVIENTRRIAERSMQLANDATRTITEQTNKAADRFPRAA